MRRLPGSPDPQQPALGDQRLWPPASSRSCAATGLLSMAVTPGADSVRWPRHQPVRRRPRQTPPVVRRTGETFVVHRVHVVPGGDEHRRGGRVSSSLTFTRPRSAAPVRPGQQRPVGRGRVHAGRAGQGGVLGDGLLGALPATRQSSTTLTETWVPAITAWPCSTAESVVSNASRSSPMGPACSVRTAVSQAGRAPCFSERRPDRPPAGTSRRAGGKLEDAEYRPGAVYRTRVPHDRPPPRELTFSGSATGSQGDAGCRSAVTSPAPPAGVMAPDLPCSRCRP